MEVRPRRGPGLALPLQVMSREAGSVQPATESYSRAPRGSSGAGGAQARTDDSPGRGDNSTRSRQRRRRGPTNQLPLESRPRSLGRRRAAGLTHLALGVSGSSGRRERREFFRGSVTGLRLLPSSTTGVFPFRPGGSPPSAFVLLPS